MRILLTAQPGWGHVLPILATASELRDRGHDVLVATGPRYAQAAWASDVPAVPAGLDWDLGRAVDAFPHLRDLDGVGRTLALRDIFEGPAVGPFLADLVDVAAAFEPDVVVSETWELAGPVVAEARGVPAIHRSVVALALPPELAIPSSVEAHLAARTRLGLPPVDHSTWLDRQRTLFGLPPSWFFPGLEPGPNVTVTRPPVPRDATAAPSWLETLDRPLVLATLGTVFWDNPAVLRRVIEAAEGEPYQTLVAIGNDADPDSVGPLPANVRVEGYVPFSAVVPRCAAVVTHGGFGTTCTAVAAGVPMVMLPLGADQFVTAGQVERLGIGAVVTGRDPVQIEVESVTGTFVNAETLTAGEISAAVRRVMSDPGVRLALDHQQDEIHSIPVDAASTAIEAASSVDVA